MYLTLVLFLNLQAVKCIGAGAKRSYLIRHEISPGGEIKSLQTEPVKSESVQLNGTLISRTGCLDCCNNGQEHVACADVETCAKRASNTSKYALVLSYVGQMVPKAFPFLQSARAAADLAKADILILMTKSDALAMSGSVRDTLEKQGVHLHVVDWALPPLMKYTKKENWCGQKDLIRLHALGLDSYDAVAYFDNDIEFQGDITPVLRCASAGNFLTTNGGLGEALNVGFFALKPHRLLLEAAVEFAKEADYSEQSGWANEGWKPSEGYYVGGECGQGFFHTLFYKRQAILRERLLKTGHNWDALQIDKCIWNYQTSFQCHKDFDCSQVRVHHKPMKPGSDPGECQKREFPRPRSPSRNHFFGGKTGAYLPDLSRNHHAVRRDEKTARFGFYFPVYDQVEGVVEVLKSARHFYPEAPIYVLQDGGSVDFGPLCRLQRFNCTFQRAPGENSRWNPHSWFARMRNATNFLQTEYVIYLEPDVKITRRHIMDPTHDAGGVYDNFNPTLAAETRVYLENLGRTRDPCFNITWTHFGLCGGSYFRSEAILDAFKPEHVLRIDWRKLKEKEGPDKTMSSDFAMTVALSARAWTVYPWEETAQHFQDAPSDPSKLLDFQRRWPACNASAAFQHNHKELYHANISNDERAVIPFFSEHLPDTTCHGCVWYKDGEPGSLMSIPSDPPVVQGVFSFTLSSMMNHTSCVIGDHFLPAAGSLLAHPDYILNAASDGLPAAKDQPKWLLKNDILVVDARQKEAGGMLILQPVFMESGGPLWGQTSAPRPRWLRSILATNRLHARRYGHAMVIRWLPSKPQLLGWQRQRCVEMSEKDCTKQNERENFNWEKHRMLQEYLESPQNFTHVMLLDADAALVRHERNILGSVAKQLATQKRDVFFTNEDWLENGSKRINGGVILARNTPFTKDLFHDTCDAHSMGPQGLASWRIGIKDHQCSSNEQICLNDALDASSEMQQRVWLASGIRYNRGGCTLRHCGEPISDENLKLGLDDPRLEILHFMGDHTTADQVLCERPVDFTGEDADGYGCSAEGGLVAAAP